MDHPTNGPGAETPDEARRREIARRLDPSPEREARWAKWREENAEAIAERNRLIDEEGLPFPPLWERED